MFDGVPQYNVGILPKACISISISIECRHFYPFAPFVFWRVDISTHLLLLSSGG